MTPVVPSRPWIRGSSSGCLQLVWCQEHLLVSPTSRKRWQQRQHVRLRILQARIGRKGNRKCLKLIIAMNLIIATKISWSFVENAFAEPIWQSAVTLTLVGNQIKKSWSDLKLHLSPAGKPLWLSARWCSLRFFWCTDLEHSLALELPTRANIGVSVGSKKWRISVLSNSQKVAKLYQPKERAKELRLR
jgi:hypothetical protein